MELNSFHAFLRKSGIKLDMRTQCIVLAAVLTAVLPLELHHLVAALVGAAAYMLLQKLDATVQRRPVQSSVHKAKQAEKNRPAADRRTPAGRKGLDEVTAKPEVRKPSVMPVQAPKFKANSWEAEVGELVDQISLTDTSRAHVESITEAVRTTLLPVLPTARVDGYVTANPMGGTAFGVAVPDVEIVVLSNPKVLAERATKDAGKFQKALIRTCTDRLVSHGSFKFRRSAFRGTEPKVTLISPTTGGQVGIPFNLAVNAATPARSSAVFEEEDQFPLDHREFLRVDLSINHRLFQVTCRLYIIYAPGGNRIAAQVAALVREDEGLTSYSSSTCTPVTIESLAAQLEGLRSMAQGYVLPPTRALIYKKDRAVFAQPFLKGIPEDVKDVDQTQPISKDKDFSSEELEGWKAHIARDERPDVALFDDEFDLFEGSIEGARALALEAEVVLRYFIALKSKTGTEFTSDALKRWLFGQVAEPSQVGTLADDEQLDSVTAFIGWDPNRGAPGDAQPLVLEEVDLEEFLRERGVDCELERLGIIGVQEAVDLQFLYVEDLIEEGIPEISFQAQEEQGVLHVGEVDNVEEEITAEISDLPEDKNSGLDLYAGGIPADALRAMLIEASKRGNVWKIVTESEKEMPEAEEYTQEELRAAQKVTGELLWDLIDRNELIVEHCAGDIQLADILTKACSRLDLRAGELILLVRRW
ncbi:Papd4, partial [Symbiodinium sp. KB8]